MIIASIRHAQMKLHLTIIFIHAEDTLSARSCIHNK